MVVAVGSALDTPTVGVGVLGLGVVVCAPLAAWRLHGRRVDGSSTAGAVLGDFAGFASLWVVLPVAGLLGHAVADIVSLAGGSMSWGEGAGAVGIVAAVLVLAAAVWLDVGAVRDLVRARGHVWLDVARLAATVAYAAWVAGVIVQVMLKPGSPQHQANAGMETVLYLVMPVVFGAAAATGADLMVRRQQKRPRARLMSGV
ncbi:MAG: hypothetical protein ACM3MJ_05435 [Deltaproteobacteria bacterium]